MVYMSIFLANTRSAHNHNHTRNTCILSWFHAGRRWTVINLLLFPLKLCQRLSKHFLQLRKNRVEKFARPALGVLVWNLSIDVASAIWPVKSFMLINCSTQARYDVEASCWSDVLIFTSQVSLSFHISWIRILAELIHPSGLNIRAITDSTFLLVMGPQSRVCTGSSLQKSPQMRLQARTEKGLP